MNGVTVENITDSELVICPHWKQKAVPNDSYYKKKTKLWLRCPVSIGRNKLQRAERTWSHGSAFVPQGNIVAQQDGVKASLSLPAVFLFITHL